jgi:3-oxoacyl-[acyl-carrier protein] reductase
MEIKNKVAIVTGGGRGIGRAISLELARNGANVAIIYHHSQDSANKVADEIRALGRKAMVIKTDVSKFTEVKLMVDKVREELGDVDILVNNAGGNNKKLNLLCTKPEEDWDDTIALNLKSVFNCCRNVIESMIERRSGNIVNIASNAGNIGQGGTIDYAAAKAGVIVFTRSLAKEVSPLGIRVNSVLCGPIATELFSDGGLTEEYQETLKRGTGLGRLGTPEDIAYMVAYLVSDKAGFITGQDIPVCGLRNWGGANSAI